MKEPPGKPLVFQGGYHPRKTKHVIRVVFQELAMYASTLERVHRLEVQKHQKMGYVFSDGNKFCKKDGGNKLRKKTCKIMYLGSIFKSGKYMFRMGFDSPFRRMISNLKYKCPTPSPSQRAQIQWVYFEQVISKKQAQIGEFGCFSIKNGTVMGAQLGNSVKKLVWRKSDFLGYSASTSTYIFCKITLSCRDANINIQKIGKI